MDEPLEDLADMVQRYYSALRQKGISEAIAQRMVCDWHQAILAVAIGETRDRVVQVASQSTRGAMKVGRS